MDHLRGTRVLVVDDYPDNCEMLAAVLEQSRALVSTAGSSAEALVALEKERPHILITDIGLPGEDGFRAPEEDPGSAGLTRRGHPIHRPDGLRQ